MNQKLLDQTTAAAQPHLADGESVVAAGMATIGKISTARISAGGVAVAALTAGALTVYKVPKKRYIALTDRRMIFLEANDMTGKATTQKAFELPVEAISTLDVKVKRVLLMIPTLVVEFAIAGMDEGLRLTFPTPYRAEGQHLADRFRAPAA